MAQRSVTQPASSLDQNSLGPVNSLVMCYLSNGTGTLLSEGEKLSYLGAHLEIATDIHFDFARNSRHKLPANCIS